MKNVTADEIKNLIQIFDDSEWQELALQVEDFRIFLSRDPNSAGAPWQGAQTAQVPATTVAPAPATAPQQPLGSAAAAQPTAAPVVESTLVPDNCVVVKAPNLGIFYRAPKPGAASYVELGAEVDNETEICLIEVMKLFTPVHAGMRGIIRHICVEDGDMVEFDQPLFYIEPTE
ncbi:acetyl-CoA carboxylase biotin carboxyl carrier protein [Kineobactrum sediminis]|nr:biotin/lipoyl-containing protein [Kineobactrum sediminis]